MKKKQSNVRDKLDNNKPIRIAHIIRKLGDGGLEAVVYYYYKMFDTNKIQFDIFYHADSVHKPPQEILERGAHFYEITPYYDNPLKYVNELKDIFRTNKYLIVHSHMNTMAILSLYAAWCAKVPIRIVHNHSVPGGHEWKRNLLKNFLKLFATVFATDLFACSEKAGRWMFGDKRYNKQQVFKMYNAIDIENFRCEINEQAVRKKYNLENHFVVGHVGRFTYAKNHKFLLEIFQRIYLQKPNAVLLLVGDGELQKQIEKEIDIMGLNEQIRIIGWVSKPIELYHVMDLFVFPSHFEGLGLAAIEAQAAGVPTLMSEAIPDEAIISNACVRLQLQKSSQEWAEKGLELSRVTVQLNDNAKKYDIHKSANILEKWYLTKIKYITLHK